MAPLANATKAKNVCLEGNRKQQKACRLSDKPSHNNEEKALREPL